MNFNEAVRNLQMTPPPSTIATFETNFNLGVKPSFHSRSNTISDDEISNALKTNTKHTNDNKPNNHHTKNSKNHKKAAQIFRNYTENEVIASNSDTYDDEFDTETDDYLSSNEEKEKPKENGVKPFDAPQAPHGGKTKKMKLRKSKSRDITRTRPRTQSDNVFLRLPNHINESDDNYDDKLVINNCNLSLPKSAPKIHTRSYSESNLQKNIQKNQWPSSPSSDETDLTNANENNHLYSRFVSMKKKYKKQRRISRQFQDAITVIQDDNEESLQITEDQIRDQFETEYEIKLIELEHDKLNTAICIEDKMKHILVQNDKLMLQNKLLHQQVAAQVAMIQEQQQMAFEQQRSFVRMHSNELNSPSTPTMAQFPSAQTILRRVSSASTINTPMLPNTVINAATNQNLSLQKSHSGHGHTQRHHGLTPHSSLNSSNFDDAHYTLNDELHSMNSMQSLHTDNSLIHVGDVNSKNNAVNMEPNHHKYKKKLLKKKKKLKEIEQHLLSSVDVKQFVTSGQTSWDRFVDLMTPSFCSCSPVVPQKSVD